MYTKETADATPPVNPCRPPSSVVLLRKPYPELPDGQEWPEGMWLMDAAALKFTQDWCGRWKGQDRPVLNFFRVIHLQSRQPFLMAASRGMVPAGLSPQSRAAAGLLEGVASITGWADRQGWAVIPFTTPPCTVESGWLAFDVRGS